MKKRSETITAVFHFIIWLIFLIKKLYMLDFRSSGLEGLMQLPARFRAAEDRTSAVAVGGTGRRSPAMSPLL